MAKNQKSNKTVQTNTDGQRIGIFGASGCGKTTKARSLITSCNRLIVFDPKQEWIREKWLKNRVIVQTIADFKRVMSKKFATGFHIVYVPNLSNAVKELSDLCSEIFKMQAGYKVQHMAKITVLIDEAQEGIPSGTSRLNPAHGALTIAKMGRDRGINMIVASQRIKTVDIGIRANLSGIYIFRLSELADINEATQIVRDKDKLLSMQNYSYFFKDLNGNINFFEKK